MNHPPYSSVPTFSSFRSSVSLYTCDFADVSCENVRVEGRVRERESREGKSERVERRVS